MYMSGLAQLHTAMQAVPIERMRFPVKHNHLHFDGLFLGDTDPYIFALACVGHNFVLRFNVGKKYDMVAYLHDSLAALKAALHLHGNSGSAFQTSVFLQQINTALPQHASITDLATHADVARVYPNIEDAHKLRFKQWIPHTAVGGRHVTLKNLEKTRLLLGQVDHDSCKANNISSAWMV